MSMSDPIADLLTRLRNAQMAGHSNTDMPSSRVKQDICRVLKEQGYIEDFSVIDHDSRSSLRVKLRYLDENRTPVMQAIRRVSRPSLRIYAGSQDIKAVRSGLGISVVSTSRGVMTGKEARNLKIGGEVLCEVW
jgi:small subunit ribosomal protein S8